MANQQELEKKLDQYIKMYERSWIHDVDWSKPSDEDLDALRNDLREKGDEFISRNDAEEFVESDNDEWRESEDFENTGDFADALVADPLGENEILEISEKVLVEATLCMNGPSFKLEFMVDPETGKCDEAYAVLTEWGSARKELDDEQRETFWQAISWKGDEIAARYSQKNSHSPYDY